MNITEACKVVRKKLGIIEGQTGSIIVCKGNLSGCPLSYFCDHGSTFYAHNIDDIGWFLTRLNDFTKIVEETKK